MSPNRKNVVLFTFENGKRALSEIRFKKKLY